jgi:two-component system C4-dicarboxylate transport response regulator DctD
MTKRILIADDDDDLRQALEQLLELEGFAIVGAPDARAALRLAREAGYDLILLDFAMPGTQGMDVLNGLLRLRPEVPIIMMSGQTGLNTVSNALDCGAYDFILKPFDNESMLATVKRALGMMN